MGQKKRRANLNPGSARSNQPRRSQSAPESRRPQGWRLWAVRVALAILTPALLLAGLEVVLRLFGYGYPTRFYVRDESGQHWYDNRKFVWQFYSRKTVLAPHPFLIPSTKPAGTIRIFILGESAAVGTPDPSYGFGRILERMLQQQYPHNRFEVVNAAIRGINSYVILPIARDCARLDPDLFIAYLGNNEVVGLHAPGPDSVNLTPHLRLLRAIHWLKSTRLGEWVGSVFERWGADYANPDKQDAEFFRAHRLAADDPRREPVYRNFRVNLEDICRVVHRSGAGLILSTIAVDLKDSPPFGSLHRADLAPPAKARWETAYHEGAAAEHQDRYPAAIEAYEKALALDDHFADLHFRIARCYLVAGQFGKARQHFALARDWDAMQFRADRRINAAIRQVAAEAAASGVHLVDAEQTFADHSSIDHGIPGENLFYEHVHLKFDGDYLLARTLYPAVIKLLAPKLGTPAAGDPPIPSRDECMAMLAFTRVNEAKLVASMIESTTLPPFTDQLEHEERLAQARQDLVRHFGDLGERDIQRAILIYQHALAQAPGDWQLDYNFAGLYFGLGRFAQAAEEFRAASRLMPYYLSTRMGLSSSLSRIGHYDEALAVLHDVLKMDPAYQPAKDALPIVESDLQRSGFNFGPPPGNR